MKNLWIFNIDSSLNKLKDNQLFEYFSSKIGENFTINIIGTPTAGIENTKHCNKKVLLQQDQLEQFLKIHTQNLTTPNDHFLFTNMWNPVVQSLKYINALSNLNWKFHGMWNGASYDPYNELGIYIGNEHWIKNLEKSFYYAYDHNYFNTIFDIDLFNDTLFQSFRESWCENQILSKKVVQSGLPFDNTIPTVSSSDIKKSNLILFPYNRDSINQVKIFENLAKELPQYQFVICENEISTHQTYYELLQQAKIVFSAGLHNNVSIPLCVEAPLHKAVPLAPNYHNYGEIFSNHQHFLYNSAWIENDQNYNLSKNELIDRITKTMDHYEMFLPIIEDYLNTRYKIYFNADEMINIFKKYID